MSSTTETQLILSFRNVFMCTWVGKKLQLDGTAWAIPSPTVQKDEIMSCAFYL